MAAMGKADVEVRSGPIRQSRRPPRPIFSSNLNRQKLHSMSADNCVSATRFSPDHAFERNASYQMRTISGSDDADLKSFSFVHGPSLKNADLKPHLTDALAFALGSASSS
jgi:hypothetical protein